MKNILVWLLFFSFFSGFQSHAGLLFNYHEMALKDLDQINKLVSDKIKESKKSREGKHVPLKEALQAVYSRPNEDGMIQKVQTPLLAELNDLEMLEKVYTDLTAEALNALTNTRAFKPALQVTYAIFLENMMAEFRPKLSEDGYQKKLVERIAHSQIEVTKEATHERKLRLMKEVKGPSEIAGDLLKLGH